MQHLKTKLLLAALILILTACEETQDPEEVVRTVNIETVVIETSNFESFLRQVGVVTTSRDVQVSAEVSGRVMEILKQEGENTSKNEPVIKIDDRRLRQEVKRLEAATNQSRENYERLKRLFEQDDIGSEIDMLNAQYSFEQNEAMLESMKLDLENTRITAPFDGRVESIFIEEGEMASPGAPVFRMISNKSKKITFGVPARHTDVVDIGDSVEIWFDDQPEVKYNLPVTFVGQSIDPQNRTFRVEVELPADIRNLKIDMIANVRLRTNQIEDVLVLDEEFVFQKNGRAVVYLTNTDENGQLTAVEREVKTGEAFANQVVIREGIQAGEELITLGSSYLQDGTRVKKSDPSSEMLSDR